MAQLRKLQGSIQWLKKNRQEAFFDIAVQLRTRETGELSEVYGGRWGKWERRYLTADEVQKQIDDAPDDIAAKKKQLQVRVIEVHKRQKTLAVDADSPLIVVVSGRRGGKSRGASVKAATSAAGIPGIGIQIICPSFSKSKIMWSYMLKNIPYDWIEYINTTDRFLRLENGSSIQFLSAHKPDSLIGECNIGLQIFDESQSISDVAVELAMPSLEIEAGSGGFFQIVHCGTPRLGAFKSRCERFKADGEATFYEFPSLENPFIETGKNSAFDLAKRTMDPARYKREILAQWQSEEGLTYYCFSRDIHCDNYVRAISAERIKDITREFSERELSYQAEHIIGIDYGQNRNVAVVYKIIKAQNRECVFAIDEIVHERDSDVHMLGTALINKGYGGAAVVDDASGQHSKGGPSASTTLDQLGFEVYHRRKNPPIIARVDALNGMMRTVDNTTRFFVDPEKCRKLCHALENQELINGKPDKTTGLDHILDSAGYPIFYMFNASVNYEQLEKTAA